MPAAPALVKIARRLGCLFCSLMLLGYPWGKNAIGYRYYLLTPFVTANCSTTNAAGS
jgi:hypothetical protein